MSHKYYTIILFLSTYIESNTKITIDKLFFFFIELPINVQKLFCKIYEICIQKFSNLNYANSYKKKINKYAKLYNKHFLTNKSTYYGSNLYRTKI